MHADGRRRLLSAALIGLGVAWIPGILLILDSTNQLASDLRNICLPAAQAMFDGRSPYVPVAQWPHQLPYDVYVYPPLFAQLVSPLLLVPGVVAGYVGGLVCFALVFAALRVVGVRDLRCFAVAAVSEPVEFTVQYANVTALIVLLVALAWRYRHWAPGAAAIALKLFVWPLALWLLVVRGMRSFVLAVGAAIALAVGSWAVIGFKGFLSYPSTLRTIDQREEGNSYAIGSTGWPLDRWLALAVAAVALYVAWSRHRKGDEAGAFALAVGAALAASPIVWIHYFTLLFVALGIRRPTLSLAWFVPLAFWVLPGTNPPTTWQLLVGVGLAGGFLGWLAFGAPTWARRLPAAVPRSVP